MIVDELVLKLKADLEDIKKSLKTVQKDGAEAGQKTGASFSDAFNAIAGAAVVAGIKSFFSNAADQYNRLTASMMRVESIARGFGRSVEQSKKQVQELADKGFLSLNQAAESFANAIALGFDEKQSRKFIDSLSDIAAYQNTIGNGAEAVTSGLAGLLSNSAEKVENIGVPVKLLNMQYQENIKTMGAAAARQKFYNGIVKEAEKFHGDAAKSVETLAGAQNNYNGAVDKAKTAIGEGLVPVMKTLYGIGGRIADTFASWFGSLSGTTKSIILFGGALALIVPALSSIIPILGALSIANPFAWVGPAVAVTAALAATLNQLFSVKPPEEIVKNYKKQREEITSLIADIKTLSEINKRTTAEELKLIDTKEALRKKTKELGLDYDLLASKAKNYADLLKIINDAGRSKAAADIDAQRIDIARNKAANEDLIRRAEQATGRSALKILEGGGQYVSIPGTGTVDVRQLLENRERYTNAGKRAQLERNSLFIDEAGNKTKAESAVAKGVETRFLELQRKLIEIEANRRVTEAAAGDPNARGLTQSQREERRRRINRGNEDAQMQAQEVVGALRNVYAEYIEDKYAADRIALQKQTNDAKRASQEILENDLRLAGKNEKLKQAAREENEKRIAKIAEANARKQAELTLQSFAQTAQAANATTGGFAQILRSKSVGDVFSGSGGFVSGLSSFSDKLKFLGPVGRGLGAVGGIISTISSFFGDSAEKQIQENNKNAEKQRQRDESAKRILESQEAYLKSINEIQIQQAAVPYKTLQNELRLIDIQAQQQALSGNKRTETDIAQEKLALVTNTLSGQFAKINEGAIGGGVMSGRDATELLNFDLKYSPYFKQARAMIEQSAAIGYSDDALRQSIGYSLTNLVNSVLKTNFQGYNISQDLQTFDINAPNATAEQSQIAKIFASIFTRPATVYTEYQADITRVQDTLSLLEQQNQFQDIIAKNTGQTAENTSKALELRPDRERSFIDVGRGYIQSLGQRIFSPTGLQIAQGLADRNISLPTSIGTAATVALAAQTLQERMLDAMDRNNQQNDTMIDILSDIRQLSAELTAVMDNNGATTSTLSVSEFTRIQSEINRRRR